MIRIAYAFTLLALAAAAHAQIDTAGSLSYTQSGGEFTYDITLRNTGTTTLGTLWYAWIPGEDYPPHRPDLPLRPRRLDLPSNDLPGFGFGLRWVADAAVRLNPGDTLSGFKFTTRPPPPNSPETPRSAPIRPWERASCTAQLPSQAEKSRSSSTPSPSQRPSSPRFPD